MTFGKPLLSEMWSIVALCAKVFREQRQRAEQTFLRTHTLGCGRRLVLAGVSLVALYMLSNPTG